MSEHASRTRHAGCRGWQQSLGDTRTSPVTVSVCVSGVCKLLSSCVWVPHFRSVGRSRPKRSARASRNQLNSLNLPDALTPLSDTAATMSAEELVLPSRIDILKEAFGEHADAFNANLDDGPSALPLTALRTEHIANQLRDHVQPPRFTTRPVSPRSHPGWSLPAGAMHVHPMHHDLRSQPAS